MAVLKELFKEPIFIEDDFWHDIDAIKESCYELYKEANSPKYHDKFNPGTQFVSYKAGYGIVHKDVRFASLSDAIYNQCKDFMKHLGYSQEQIDRLYISRSWFNISSDGDYMERHVHPQANFTSVFYVESTEDDKLTIVKNVYDMLERPINMNEWSNTVFNMDCLINRLGIFRADAVHGVNRDKSGKRITIVHNFTIGNKNV